MEAATAPEEVAKDAVVWLLVERGLRSRVTLGEEREMKQEERRAEKTGTAAAVAAEDDVFEPW